MSKKKRARNEQYDGPFIVSTAGREYAVIGPWGLVKEGLGRFTAGDLAIWLNKGWDDGYHQGIKDTQLLIDPCVSRPIPKLYITYT